MESLSKEKNLIFGLLLGMAIAIAIPYAQPSELRASEEVTAVLQEDRFDDVIETILGCLDRSTIKGPQLGDQIFLQFQAICTR